MTQSEFFKHELISRDTVDVKMIYVDIAGDLVSGVLLSQIMFWHLPNKEGETKLRVKKQGHLWLAKKREDWWDECRVSPKQFDRSVKELEKRQCVKTKLFKFDGNPTKHVRINWDTFLTIYNAVLSHGTDFVVWEGVNWLLTKGEYPNLLIGNIEIDQRGISLTETTLTETTTENGSVSAINDNIESPSTHCDFQKSENPDVEKKQCSSFRSKLKGEELKSFELIADNFDKVVCKTLLEFVQQSTTAVTGAYEECKQREVNHFSYFTKVFFSHLQKGVKDGGTATVDYDNINEGLYK